MRTATTACDDEADLVILELVRWVTADAWALEKAVAGLLAKGYSREALALAQDRVRHARVETGAVIADRAAVTLSAALDVGTSPVTPPLRG